MQCRYNPTMPGRSPSSSQRNVWDLICTVKKCLRLESRGLSRLTLLLSAFPSHHRSSSHCSKGCPSGACPGDSAPSKGPSAQSLCLLLQISVLKTDSRGRIAGINCTSPVLQSRAKMRLCNLKLVLLSKMFHQINCKRKQSVISYARLSTLSYVRSAFVDKNEGTLYSFKNGVPYLGYNEETNWILKDLAIAIYFQCINFCYFSTVFWEAECSL